MNIFVIHKSNDKEKVNDSLMEMKKTLSSLNPLMLENGGKLWKIEARRKIKQADVVMYFCGETSHTSKYIGWELETSLKLSKEIFIIPFSESYIIHKALNRQDDFSSIANHYGVVCNEASFVEKINEWKSSDYYLFNENNTDKMVMLEQYKIFLETSEALVSRRQSVSNFYIMANTIIVTLIGTMNAFDVPIMYKIIMCILFSALGFILDYAWLQLLGTYGSLNASKMEILSKIEQRLPLSMFDAEWEVLSNKFRAKKYVSFTESEKRMPKIFMTIYAITTFVFSLIGIVNLF